LIPRQRVRTVNRISKRLERRVMPQGTDRTKEQLYRQAKQLGIKGRSKMNKGQLKAAIERRR
jgi:Rho termination factor, N-terminal domain